MQTPRPVPAACPPPAAALLQHWRSHQGALAQWAVQQGDPHAELLALVWGPTWDWAQAGQIGHSACLPEAVLHQAARLFEASPPPSQQRLRQLILRHRRRHAPAQWENAAPCPASC